MNTIIVTGFSGFVGVNFINYYLENRLGNIYKLNLREKLPEVLPRSNALLHLAGKAHDVNQVSGVQEYFDVNFGKTRDLFDLFLNSEVEDFVYFSSVKSIADTVDGILTEDTLPNPKTPYGQSKLQAEKYILGKELPEGKRVFILRPCMIHGPGNKGNLNLLYKIVNKGIPYPLGAFHNQRSFLSISNLNYIVKQLLSDRTIPGGVYNLADDISLSTNEVVKIIAQADDRTPRLWRVNSGLIKAVALAGDKLHLPLNSERLKKLTESYVVSNEKIKRALNIEKLPISSEDGLLRTIKSFRSK